MGATTLDLEPGRLPDGLPEIVARLKRITDGADRVLVLCHDNPDPDALASAFLLSEVLTHLTGSESEAEVAYGGIVGRAENRAMIRELELKPVPLHELDLAAYDTLALVDTQPGAGNNSLPEDRDPAIIVDHHPPKCDPEAYAFVDIRESYGATCTMVAEYASHCDVPLPPKLATAVVYAIKSETQDLGREAAAADHRVYMTLFPRVDVGALARIQRARVPREYFRSFRDAIEEARVYGRAVVTNLGRIDTPDIVAEIADFLLRLEGADWSCCMGRFDEQLVVSLRTSQPDAHAGQVIRDVVAGRGSAGGHGMSAGGQLPFDETDYETAATDLRRRLLAELDASRPGEPLVISR